MDMRFVRGACTCGRNRYTVAIPQEADPTEATVLLDSSSESRRIHASPLTAFLRVPLGRFHSSTYALYPDEDHNSIRRTYTTPLLPGTRRQFCGYCGTQLSSWSERTQEDADFICLTLGTLLDDDMEILEEMGLLPTAEEMESGEERISGQSDDRMEEIVQNQDMQQSNMVLRNGNVKAKGSPWFEEMVEDSALGRVRRQKGGHISADGTTRVEFEVIEVEQSGSEAGSGEPSRAKRKHEDELGGGGRGANEGEQQDYYMSGALASDAV